MVGEILEYENRLKLGFEIFDAGTGEKLTKGHTVQVAVDAISGELMFASPDALIQRIERLLAEPNQ